MIAYMDPHGVLHVEATELYEALALKAWEAKFQITNVNGILMIPSRGLTLHHGTSHLPSLPPQPK